MSDALYSGTRFRVLNIIDEGTREALDIVVDTSLPATEIVKVLEQLKKERPHESLGNIFSNEFKNNHSMKSLVMNCILYT